MCHFSEDIANLLQNVKAFSKKARPLPDDGERGEHFVWAAPSSIRNEFIASDNPPESVHENDFSMICSANGQKFDPFNDSVGIY